MRRASCVRDVTLSLRNTFLRWYSTELALRKSWAAISLLEAPSVASSATRASWGVRSRLVGGGAPARPPTGCRDFAARSPGEAVGTHAKENLVGGPEVVAGGGAALGAPQPLR